MEENANAPVLKPGLIYGVIAGLVSVVVSLLLYFTGQTLETWAMVLSSVISIAVLVYLLVLYKKEYGKGFVTYGRLIGLSVLIGLVASILISVYTFALYSADDAYLQDMKYYALEKMDKRMEKTDAKYQEKMTDDQYDMFEERMDEAREKGVNKINSGTPMTYARQSVFGGIFMYLIIGLIAGIFIKRKPELFPDREN